MAAIRLKNCNILQKHFTVWVFSLLLSSGLIGQNKIEIDGIIKTDSIINPINIINYTQQTGTSVLPFENFKLQVQKNDTLIISALNFHNQTIIIDSEILKRKKIEIFLIEKINELEEVRIHKLTGILEKDIKNIKTFDKFKLNAPMSRKEPLTQNERRIYTATTGPGGTKLNLLNVLTGRIPIDPILNKINGRTKRLKNIQELNEKDRLLKELKVRFPATFFKDFLRIEKPDINLFLVMCIENSDLPEKIESLNQVGLIDSLQVNANYFKEHYEKLLSRE